MAVSLLKMHQIFMLAFVGLRVEGEVAQVLVVSQPPPLAFLVFLLSDWWEACATRQWLQCINIKHTFLGKVL